MISGIPWESWNKVPEEKAWLRHDHSADSTLAVSVETEVYGLIFLRDYEKFSCSEVLDDLLCAPSTEAEVAEEKRKMLLGPWTILPQMVRGASWLFIMWQRSHHLGPQGAAEMSPKGCRKAQAVPVHEDVYLVSTKKENGKHGNAQLTSCSRSWEFLHVRLFGKLWWRGESGPLADPEERGAWLHAISVAVRKRWETSAQSRSWAPAPRGSRDAPGPQLRWETSAGGAGGRLVFPPARQMGTWWKVASHGCFRCSDPCTHCLLKRTYRLGVSQEGHWIFPECRWEWFS